MANSKYSSSSKRWLKQYFNDRYVIQRKKRKVRSRAWFKLDQINNLDILFRPGMNVVDLGSSPGSWSEYAKTISKYGRIIACDILPMDNIIGVDFLQGDICDFSVLKKFLDMIDRKKVDIVLSDMSPNISGIVDIDVSKSIYLGECALNVCRYVLISGGSFLVKIFQGGGFNEYCRNVRSLFNTVKIRKPIASHVHSREVYVVAKKYNI